MTPTTPTLTLAPDTPTPEPPTPQPTAPVPIATDPPSATPPQPTEPTGRSPFRRVDDFLGPQEDVYAVTLGGPGYVAVGWAGDDCTEGRVWTSENGRDWVRQSTDMPDSYLEEIIGFKGELFAFGHEVGNCSRVGSGMGWRSPDGVTWTQTAAIPAAAGHWMDVVATDDRLVAFTSSTGGTTWLSSDGEDWRRPLGGSPDSYRSAGVVGSTVVVAESSDELGAGLTPDVSVDGGDTWQEVSIQSRYVLEPFFAVSNGVLLAATRACCDRSGNDVGIPLTTRDGLDWSVAAEPLLHPADAAVAAPGGFVTISNDGSSAVSADGQTWFAGPRMPVSEFGRSIRDATSGATGILLVTMDFYNGMEYDWHLWFAPIDAFDRSRWTTPVRLAE